MKLIVIRGNIKNGFDTIERSGGDNTNLPILKNLLIKAEDGKIIMTSTNLEVGITAFVSGKVVDGGAITIPIHLFGSILNNIQSERLDIETKGNDCIVKTESYESVLKGLPANEFPIIPKAKNKEEYIEVKGDVLKDALVCTVIATQQSDIRQELNNILFIFSLNDIKFVATDSFRLSEKTINENQFTTNHKSHFKFLLPLKTANELIRIIKDGDTVRIYHDENQALFTSERFEFISRLSESVFPEYQAVVPKTFSSELVLGREEFANALKLTGVFGSRNGEVRLKVSEGKKIIEINSEDQALGGNKYIIPAKINGKSGEAGFNWRYLSDGLKALKTEEVVLSLNTEENKPSIMRSQNDASYFYIVMPLLRD